MNLFRESHKTQVIRPQNPYFSNLSCGVCLQNTYDYSPFGVILDERTVEGDFYRYGFQKQEKDDEFKGKGNSLNFEYRMDDSRVGRFFTVDAIAAKYPKNSPYSFSENRILDAIELEGLEAFFIHGTCDGASMWTRDKEVKANMKSLLGLTNSKTMDAGFSWEDKTSWYEPLQSGTSHQLNNSYDRGIAAENLANYVFENRKKGEEITLIGMSHGGNVAIQAAEILYEKHGIKVNIITVNTPAYNMGVEDPEGKKGINDMISFWDKGDIIAGGLSLLSDNFYGPYSKDYYDKDAQTKTTNIESISNQPTGEKAHNSIYFDANIIQKTVVSKKVKRLEPIKN
jgi:hypothetical protein